MTTKYFIVRAAVQVSHDDIGEQFVIADPVQRGSLLNCVTNYAETRRDDSLDFQAFKLEPELNDNVIEFMRSIVRCRDDKNS